MSKKNSITSYLMPITALCILLFFGYKGFVIKSVKFDDIIFLTKTVDGQQDNVVILPCGHIIQSDCWDLVNANPATANRCVICRIPTARYQEQIFTISSQEILNKFITD